MSDYRVHDDGPSRGPSPSRLPAPGFIAKQPTTSSLLPAPAVAAPGATTSSVIAQSRYVASAMMAAERLAPVQGSNVRKKGSSNLGGSSGSGYGQAPPGGYRNSTRRSSNDTGAERTEDSRDNYYRQAQPQQQRGVRPVPNPSMLMEPPNYVKQKSEEAQAMVRRLRAEAREREERKRRIAEAESRLLSAELAVLDISRHEKERQLEDERRMGVERRKEMARVS
jgi:hypothetical protein